MRSTTPLPVAVLFLILTKLIIKMANGQSCVGLGKLCERSTDCCRGCCETYQCVDRTYCNSDMGMGMGLGMTGMSMGMGMGMGAIGGLGLGSGGGCQAFPCPSGQMCTLTPVCPTCPSQPICRPTGYGGGYGNYYLRNSADKSSDPTYAPLVLMVILTSALNFCG